MEKLGRRQSTTVYDRRSVMMMTMSEDDLDLRGPTTEETRQRGTTGEITSDFVNTT